MGEYSTVVLNVKSLIKGGGLSLHGMGVGVAGKTSGKNSKVCAGGRATVKPSSFLYVNYET